MKFKLNRQHKQHVNENRIRAICDKADVIYNGIQYDWDNRPVLVLFTDKKTLSTLAIKIDIFSYKAVLERLSHD